MQKLFIILSSIILSLCSYRELTKGDFISVIPGTNVYFDISSFDEGDTISFEFEMDLDYGLPISRTEYQLGIGQVPATTYTDSYYWSNLQTVTNKNVSCDISNVCTFKWEEKKKSGNTYIFIYPDEPYTGFYSSHGERIKISHISDSGLSAGAIVGIVFACLFFITIIVLLIVFCCCCNGDTTGCCYRCCPNCTLCCCPSRYRVAPVPYPVSYGTGMQVAIQQPVYGTPVISAYPNPVPAVYPPGYM